MIYPIIMYGDAVLRKKAQDIEVGSEVKTLSDDMFETMYAAHGIGLAAPQIGKSVRMFVVDGSVLSDEEPQLKNFKKIFINAEIIEEDEEAVDLEEGCLSIPNIREKVVRPDSIRIKYYDENWKLHEREFKGMKARIIQHEYDHIEGVLFIDYLTPFKKRLLKGKLSNISRGVVDTEYRILAPLKR